MITVLATCVVALYVTTCWYSLRRHDQKLRAKRTHPTRRK